jgi:hypothetical protein
LKAQSLHYIWKASSIVSKYTAAVSLHSHTQYSKESLEFVPRYAHRIPLVSYLVRRQEQKYQRVHGCVIDFDTGWWTPPLSARQAYDLERTQIRRDLGLEAMVSLTDHDNIEAPMTLHVLPEMKDVPISVEWTVPYGASYFHVGVHNLPVRCAHEVMARLEAYTSNPVEETLPELFSILYGMPSVLIVLNHPLWDEPGLGAANHRHLLIRFLTAYRQWIHALEINGLRSWEENFKTVRLAAEMSLPLISGGDRHGCEPNGIVNLTRASSFEEFVAEVRSDRRSEVLFLAQYREPLGMRLMQGVLDVVRDYTDLPEGRCRWTDRVFFREPGGAVKPLSAVWKGDGPAIVKMFMTSVRLLERRRVKNAIRIFARRVDASRVTIAAE